MGAEFANYARLWRLGNSVRAGWESLSPFVRSPAASSQWLPFSPGSNGCNLPNPTTICAIRGGASGFVAALKAERASVAARGRQIETEAAPIRYVAELVGGGEDHERAIRWLIALMVLCCDPLAITLTAAASTRRSATESRHPFEC